VTAALALASAIDPATIAPEDWQYLGDLVPLLLPVPVPRESGIVLRLPQRPVEVTRVPYRAPAETGALVHVRPERPCTWRLRALAEAPYLAACMGLTSNGAEAWSVRGRKRERPSRAMEHTPKPRVLLQLTDDEKDEALAALRRYPRRRQYERDEWLSQVWLELVNPPKEANPTGDLATRIERAIWRAEQTLRKFCPAASFSDEEP
jgi:hypothetical protein